MCVKYLFYLMLSSNYDFDHSLTFVSLVRSLIPGEVNLLTVKQLINTRIGSWSSFRSGVLLFCYAPSLQNAREECVIKFLAHVG